MGLHVFLPQLHQMKDVNDLKMKQGMGVKPWVIRQHMSSCQCYHFHQQLNILQSPIQPLRLLVPTNYPNCYPILLDKLPVESEHGARSSIYDEVKAIVKKKWAKSEEVEVQLTQYQYDGMPEDKRFNGKKALSEASVIVREHTPLTNMFMCLWFNEVVQFTSRDQLSFPYVLWRLKVLENVNVFPVCTRKDLVNSMGHIRKAKPLGS
ncbi:probable hexosyltransferase MUCI70 isoform X2 [Pyrus x bretschneideri]|uniref:probable hexosyltransferase MUCI70 isoform X2 n=1 Tax=Pyrus x bretschneideri TaxID=225117 RepID=UPI002030360F|nr:probable hexosyltransferase MUCI70 isoform X2 [Pyrus x bretschneideri]